MKKIEIDCFEITVPDGAGIHEVHVAYVDNTFAAEAIAEEIGRSNYGWPGNVRKFKKSFTIVSSVDEFKALKTEDAKEAALAKLTAADKQALGL